MNKKIKQYSALALATASILPMSCSKDKETNDENIDDKTVNKVLSAVATSATEFGKEDSIDVNGDGQFDFNLVVGGEVDGAYSYGYCGAKGKDPSNQILSSDQTIGPYTVPFATIKNNGDKINSSSVNWENGAYFSYKINSSSTGFAGAGDKLIGFRFKAGANTHYGWMKVNAASDYKTLTIKELAYNKTPDAEITAGAK
jgi:hypothetical protein